jgi:hypothetical protein
VSERCAGDAQKRFTYVDLRVLCRNGAILIPSSLKHRRAAVVSTKWIVCRCHHILEAPPVHGMAGLMDHEFDIKT